MNPKIRLRTIAVTSLKGGAGKSTLAFHLAIAAHLRGCKVRLVDVDPLGGCYAAMSFRTRDGPDAIRSQSSKVFNVQSEARRDGCDFLVIDTPANAKDSVANCLLISDLALIVARPSYLDLEGAAQTFILARQLSRRALGVISQANAGRFGRESLNVERAQRAMRAAGLNCAQTVVHNRLAYQQALATGKSVEEPVLPGRELNAAAQEISSLYDEIFLQLK